MPQSSDSNGSSSSCPSRAAPFSYSASSCVSLATAIISDLLHSERPSARSRRFHRGGPRERSRSLEPFELRNSRSSSFGSSGERQGKENEKDCENEEFGLYRDGDLGYPDLRNACALCGHAVDLATTKGEEPDADSKLVVRCCRRACQRKFHVKCLLACCSYFRPELQPSAFRGPDRLPCLPTEHVYRTDTEMCGLCHYFAHGWAKALELDPLPADEGQRYLKRRKAKDDIEEWSRHKWLALPLSGDQNEMEEIWHLKPNAKRAKAPMSLSSASCFLKLLRLHIPTPRGVIVQPESYIWRISSEPLKARAKILGQSDCSFRFSKGGFLEARLAAINRFNELARMRNLDPTDVSVFEFPNAHPTAWSTPCALRLRRIAEIQRSSFWPEYHPVYRLKSQQRQHRRHPAPFPRLHEVLQSFIQMPEWLSTRAVEDKLHLKYPPVAMFSGSDLRLRPFTWLINEEEGGKGEEHPYDREPLPLPSFNRVEQQHFDDSREPQLQSSSEDVLMMDYTGGQSSTTSTEIFNQLLALYQQQQGEEGGGNKWLSALSPRTRTTIEQQQSSYRPPFFPMNNGGSQFRPQQAVSFPTENAPLGSSAPVGSSAPFGSGAPLANSNPFPFFSGVSSSTPVIQPAFAFGNTSQQPAMNYAVSGIPVVLDSGGVGGGGPVPFRPPSNRRNSQTAKKAARYIRNGNGGGPFSFTPISSSNAVPPSAWPPPAPTPPLTGIVIREKWLKSMLPRPQKTK